MTERLESGPPRGTAIARRTAETAIDGYVALDGTGTAQVATGVGFLDHMLAQLARHALLDLRLTCSGDTWVDDHHTVEDCALALGAAVRSALGDKAGITRFAAAHVPMDDALVRAVIDLSGRGYLVFDVPFEGREKIGTFDTELVREFFQGFASAAGATLHVHKLAGLNAHHTCEAAFKALARALRGAVAIDPGQAGQIPSTKGRLGD